MKNGTKERNLVFTKNYFESNTICLRPCANTCTISTSPFTNIKCMHFAHHFSRSITRAHFVAQSYYFIFRMAWWHFSLFLPTLLHSLTRSHIIIHFSFGSLARCARWTCSSSNISEKSVTTAQQFDSLNIWAIIHFNLSYKVSVRGVYEPRAILAPYGIYCILVHLLYGVHFYHCTWQETMWLRDAEGIHGAMAIEYYIEPKGWPGKKRKE